jgi:creatinine amidohydrolase
MSEDGWNLANLSWPEVQRELQKIEFSIIPTGSTEQHGPNLGLKTDIAIATALAEKIGERMQPRALVVPGVAWGISYHHLSFPGTLTLSPETFMNLVVELAQSLKHHGIQKVLIVNGHGGNQSALNLVLTRLRHECGIQAANMFWLSLVDDVIREHVHSPRYGHACEVETSLAMYLAPEIVKHTQLSAGEIKPYPYPHSDPRGAGFIDAPFTWAELTDNGAFGDARQASREFGEILTETIVSRTVAFVESWLADSAPRGTEKEVTHIG